MWIHRVLLILKLEALKLFFSRKTQKNCDSLKKKKRREEIPESTRKNTNSTQPDTRQHTKPTTHKPPTKCSKEIGAPVI
jgi:hypothetical protein